MEDMGETPVSDVNNTNLDSGSRLQIAPKVLGQRGQLSVSLEMVRDMQLAISVSECNTWVPCEAEKYGGFAIA